MTPRLAIALVAAALAAGACGDDTPPPQSQAHEPAEPAAGAPHRVALGAESLAIAGIVVEAAAPGRLSVTLALHGHVAPNADTTVRLAPRFPAVVLEARKRVGDRVSPGEVVAVLESSESLRPFELRSRLGGAVVERNGALGEPIEAGRALYVVADLATVWIDLHAHRHDVARLRPGQRVRVRPDRDAEPVETTLSYVAPVGGEESQTVLARAVLANPTGRFRPGLFVEAEVVVDEALAEVTVPSAAVQHDAERPVVYVRDAEGFEERAVTLGRKDAERTEVTAGLAAGERVATQGSYWVKAELEKGAAEHEH